MTIFVGNGDVESFRWLQQVHCLLPGPTCGVVEACVLPFFDAFSQDLTQKSAFRLALILPLSLEWTQPTWQPQVLTAPHIAEAIAANMERRKSHFDSG
ncbi:MAG TPA: hypothetical protein VKD65_07690 [Candidatus Angelobacter sp.]|nr:hypothetical protein [Candidatus Angelobacter sp.]